MSVSEIKWDNYNYELSLCRNYQNLKKFIENDADESWPFFPQRFDYLNQIKLFSKQDLAQYYPDKNLNEFLEKSDAPFPVYDRHFFSHLPLQISFIKFIHIENLLDYHFRTYIKYKPEYETAFLNIIENSVVSVIEKNQIHDHTAIISVILKWVRHKNEFIDLKKSQISYIQNIKNEFIDLSVSSTYHIIQEYAASIQNMDPEPTKKPVETKPQKSLKTIEPIKIYAGIKNEFMRAVYELVDSGTTEADWENFEFWINEIASRKLISKKYTIKRTQVSEFCRVFKKFYQRKAFGGIGKNILANWIIEHFVQHSPTGEKPLTYTTVYNLLRGSKK